LLSPAQSLVCQTITRFGQASTSQLRALHYTGTVYGNKTRSNRHLKALSERGLVRRIPHRLYGYQQGSGEFVYCPPESTARTPNLHTLDITGLYVALTNQCRQVSNMVFDPEPWAHTTYGGHAVTPDFYAFVAGGHFWGEVDRSSESPSVIGSKMARYVKAYRGNATESDQPDVVFPQVLWIAHDKDRVRILEREAQKKGVPGLFTCLLYDEAVAYMTK
jgi:hypothetical protein